MEKICDEIMALYKTFLDDSSIDIQERANMALQTISFFKKIELASLLQLFEGLF
jgi:hypothetical protein